ncbi:hypothetical protein AWENTII_005584 [Aspergillus wentii]
MDSALLLCFWESTWRQYLHHARLLGNTPSIAIAQHRVIHWLGTYWTSSIITHPQCDDDNRCQGLGTWASWQQSTQKRLVGLSPSLHLFFSSVPLHVALLWLLVLLFWAAASFRSPKTFIASFPPFAVAPSHGCLIRSRCLRSSPLLRPPSPSPFCSLPPPDRRTIAPPLHTRRCSRPVLVALCALLYNCLCSLRQTLSVSYQPLFSFFPAYLRGLSLFPSPSSLPSSCGSRKCPIPLLIISKVVSS